MQTETENLLIFFDERKYKNQTEKLEDFIQNFFEPAISNFNKLGIGKFEKGDFIDLFSFPKDFLYRKFLENKSTEVEGMKVDKEQLFNLLEKPVGYFQLIEKVEELQKEAAAVLAYVFNRTSYEYFLNLFEFDNDNKLQVTLAATELIQFQNEIYVSKESSKATFKLLKKLEAIFNGSPELIEATAPPYYRVGDFIHKYLPFVIDEKRFKINIDKIKWDDSIVNSQ